MPSLNVSDCKSDLPVLFRSYSSAIVFIVGTKCMATILFLRSYLQQFSFHRHEWNLVEVWSVVKTSFYISLKTTYKLYLCSDTWILHPNSSFIVNHASSYPAHQVSKYIWASTGYFLISSTNTLQESAYIKKSKYVCNASSISYLPLK